jgi:nucleotide-binding universal stress UspA family protein
MKVLSPIDFSDGSSHSLTFAANFCIQTKSQLIVLHAFDMYLDYSDNVDPMVMYQVHLEASQNKFQSKLSQTREQYPDLDIQGHFLIKDAFRAIEEISESENIDLCFVGRTGATGIESIIIGSTANKLINHSKIPIMVVPSFVSFEYMRTGSIVFATDFSNYPNQQQVSLVQQFVSLCSGDFYIFHHDVPGQPYLSKEQENKMLSLFHNCQPSLVYSYKGTFTDTLDALTEEKEAKMVVMVSKHKGFLQRFFEGHKTTKLASKTNHPLLILHSQ